MGKKVIWGWEEDFEAKANDALAYVNSKREQGNRYPSFNHWMMTEIISTVTEGATLFDMLATKGVLLEAVPEKRDEIAWRPREKKHVILIGDLTYANARKNVSYRNYATTEQLKIQGQLVGKPPFAFLAAWLKSFSEEFVLRMLQQAHLEASRKEQEGLLKELEKEMEAEEIKS